MLRAFYLQYISSSFSGGGSGYCMCVWDENGGGGKLSPKSQDRHDMKFKLATAI